MLAAASEAENVDTGFTSSVQYTEGSFSLLFRHESLRHREQGHKLNSEGTRLLPVLAVVKQPFLVAVLLGELESPVAMAT